MSLAATRQPAHDRTRRELVGIVTSIPFHDPASGYIVARLRTGEDVVGECQDGEIEPGIAYRFLGRWVENPRRGWQFRFEMLTPELPADRRGVIAYLVRETRMVTEALAKKMCDAYGAPQVIRILRDEPERAVADSFIGPWKSGELSRLLKELERWERTKIDLFTLFAGRGFPRNTIKAACQHPALGVRAAELIRKDPYRMVVHDLPGVGFTRADKLYLVLGHNPARLKRQLLAAWDALRSDTEGHTWHIEGAARRAILAAVGLAAARFDAAIALGLRSRWLAQRKDAEGRTWFTERKKAEDEATVARELARLMRCQPRLWPAIGEDNPLSQHQRAALRMILTGPVAVLGGRPGTGKTYTAAWVLGAVRRLTGKDRINVVAPTGKAAVRITEAIERYQLDLHEACTIHRALEIGRNGHDGKGWGFLRNRERPLDVSLVVIDEASMVDTPLMAALLSAIPDGAHLLIVGDPGQLPPVGHCCPLRDMIAAGMPNVTLTEVRRNAGLIVGACCALAEGKKFKTCDVLDPETGDNLRWIETDTPAGQIELLGQIIAGIKASGKYDPIWDVQVLCAMNEASAVSRVPLNALLQAVLNPPVTATRQDNATFRLGDKIICLRNSFMAVWQQMEGTPGDQVNSYSERRDSYGGTGGEVREAFVANGDVGRVLAVDDKHAVVRFLWPDRLVRIELRRTSKDDPGENTAGGTMGDFALAYALTTHKSQGSEYPIVIVMADDAAGMVASREHWYTSISRAAKLCICLGRRATCDRQCREAKLPKRRTFLAELIREFTNA